MIRACTLLLPMALLAACNQPATPPAKAPEAVNPGPPLIPNPMPPSYIGRWAASLEQCAAGAWTFTDKGLSTAGEVSCAFTQVTPNETGWIAEGACITQTPAKPATLVLNTVRSGTARTLAVSGGPFTGSQVLLACDAPGGAVSRVQEAKAADVRLQAVPPFDFTQNKLIAKGWRENGQVTRIVEPLLGDVGRKIGERTYDFRAGEADPFLVRDGEGAYAFDGGKLAGVFSREGTELQPLGPTERAELESRLLQRAHELRQAADPASKI